MRPKTPAEVAEEKRVAQFTDAIKKRQRLVVAEPKRESVITDDDVPFLTN